MYQYIEKIKPIILSNFINHYDEDISCGLHKSTPMKVSTPPKLDEKEVKELIDKYTEKFMKEDAKVYEETELHIDEVVSIVLCLAKTAMYSNLMKSFRDEKETKLYSFANRTDLPEFLHHIQKMIYHAVNMKWDEITYHTLLYLITFCSLAIIKEDKLLYKYTECLAIYLKVEQDDKFIT